MQLGISPSQQPAPPSVPSLVLSPENPVSVGGVLTLRSAKQMLNEELEQAQKAQAAPVLRGLAGHIKKCWSAARTAKQNTVEPRMLQSLRQRRGEYDPDVLAEIRAQGGSEIYMMVTSTKCRAAASWLRDVLLGTQGDRPWSVAPTPIPDLPPDVTEALIAQAKDQIAEYMRQSGQMPDPQHVRAMMAQMHDDTLAAARTTALTQADRMADKMEDQLVEGGWLRAVNDFLDDMTTFPAAILKGPVVRRKPRLKWVQTAAGWTPEVQDELVLEVERVDPFNLYPAPNAADVDDGYLIERHRLTRGDLEAMKDVAGYDTAAIKMVLSQYGQRGLHEWLWSDTAKAVAEGKSTTALIEGPDPEIDALQFWGPVAGQTLLDWGMDEDEVPDATKEYNVEAWLIGDYVIKATLNYDPMGRRPYYKTSWEEVPGSFWGNSVADLVRDAQKMCNSAARALANNMGIASGPQVGINIERLPQGEDITQMTPWKIYQFTSDPYGGNARPIEFFQPSSLSQELMYVYDKFANLADEHSGVPRYMTGDSPAGGAGRTASGMSMLMTNAGKSIKQVVANIDVHVIQPLIERLYYHNMRYADDPALKGDVQVVARGAMSIIAKESAQVRRNEFLQLALTSPIVQQVIGMEGIADLLREGAKTLDMDGDKLVPSMDVLRERWRKEQQAQLPAQGTPPAPGGGEVLQDGAPVTDNFAPARR